VEVKAGAGGVVGRELPLPLLLQLLAAVQNAKSKILHKTKTPTINHSSPARGAKWQAPSPQSANCNANETPKRKSTTIYNATVTIYNI
jgi:hypothetical protein